MLTNTLSFLESDEKAEFSTRIKASFLETLKSRIDSPKLYEDPIVLCNFEKPIFLLDNEWNEIIEKAKKQYLLLKKLEVLNDSKRNLEKLFESDIPKIFNKTEWEYIIEIAKNCYTNNAFEDFFRHFNYEDVSSSFKTEYISNWKLVETIFNEIEVSKYILRAINYSSKELSEVNKPQRLDGKAESAIKQYVNEKELLGEKLRNVTIEQSKIEELKIKILSQLDTLDKLLKDPMTIDRIEEYESVFSKGNYANLKKIADILKGLPIQV